MIEIFRHGQAVHNVQHDYRLRDPPSTEAGRQQALAKAAQLERHDLVLISPMTRTIETALLAYGQEIGHRTNPLELQIWPDLREANDAICNKGVSRAETEVKFPQFDFSQCPDEWNYPEHSVLDTTARAERVRRRLKGLTSSYKRIALVTHRCLVAYLVRGEPFANGEVRQFGITAEEEVHTREEAIHVDTGLLEDYGPTLLVPYEATSEHPSSNEAEKQVSVPEE